MLGDFFSFSATETGYNHIKAEPSKVCEDASGNYDDELMNICVVADGHGSDNYPRTDRGSKYAVQAAIEQIKEFVNSTYNPFPKDLDRNKKESVELISKILSDNYTEVHPLKGLSQSILTRWYELVGDDFQKNPFTENELKNVSDKYKSKYLSEQDQLFEKAYGCTLIAYVVTDSFSFGLQIGDGKCIVIDASGEFTEPIPWDENCQLNVTTSICDADAGDEFRFYSSSEKPAAVFAGSDGIDDSYASEEEVYALYRSMLKIFIEYGDEVGKSEIKEYLPVLTKKGSGDDVSVALIINPEKVQGLLEVFNIQTELFDLQNKLKEKEYAFIVNEERDKNLFEKLSKEKGLEDNDSIDSSITNEINDLRQDRKGIDDEISAIQKEIGELSDKLKKVREIYDVDAIKVSVSEESIESEKMEQIPSDDYFLVSDSKSETIDNL